LKLRVVAFDLDGTLVRDRSSWTTIHRRFGVEEAARSHMPLYESGKIDYQEFMRRDIALWPRKLHVRDIDLILSDFLLNPQALGVISEIRKMGYEVAIVSAGIDLLADRVAKTLGVELVIANGLQTDVDGYLTGHGIFRVDLLHKDLALQNVLRKIGVMMRQCMTVGDSKYDISFLQRAGYGVAMGDDPDLGEATTFVIRDLPEVLHCIKLVEANPQVVH
jgi:phosphoserine phosphatase